MYRLYFVSLSAAVSASVSFSVSWVCCWVVPSHNYGLQMNSQLSLSIAIQRWSKHWCGVLPCTKPFNSFCHFRWSQTYLITTSLLNRSELLSGVHKWTFVPKGKEANCKRKQKKTGPFWCEQGKIWLLSEKLPFPDILAKKWRGRVPASGCGPDCWINLFHHPLRTTCAHVPFWRHKAMLCGNKQFFHYFS